MIKKLEGTYRFFELSDDDEEWIEVQELSKWEGNTQMSYDEWMTPPEVIELARKAMGSIDFDPASNLVAQEYVKAKEFCIMPDSNEIVNDGGLDTNFPINCHYNGLEQYWHGNVWCNPPYSAGNIDAFVDKAIDEWINNAYWSNTDGNGVNQMLYLVNSATDTRWYHKLLHSASSVLLWRGRIKFWKIVNGEALEKWEGVKSKAEGKGKIGNSPRYLNTLFYFGSNVSRFKEVFVDKGTFLKVG